jgi:hypothetical protein
LPELRPVHAQYVRRDVAKLHTNSPGESKKRDKAEARLLLSVGRSWQMLAGWRTLAKIGTICIAAQITWLGLVRL